METIKLTIPSQFLSALINGDESGLSDNDSDALNLFVDDMLKQFKCFHAIDTTDEAGFVTYHDMRSYGVLASDCETVTFDTGGSI